MLQTNKTWLSIGIISLLISLVLIGGFIYAIKDILYPEASEELQNTALKKGEMTDNRIMIVGIGDSLTKGEGDNNGKGYIGYLAEELRTVSNKPVNVLGNLAVSGYRTDQLLLELNKPGVQYSLSKANLIVLTIGGNDLFSVGRDEVDPRLIEERLPATIERLRQIIDRIDRINPKAQVYYTGLYNPFSELKNARETSLAVQKWNSAAFEVISAYPQMTFVPSFDLFSKNPRAYLAVDQFHPNQIGYERIARRIAELVE